MKRRALMLLLALSGCDYARLRDDGLFACEENRTCSQKTAAGEAYVCGSDELCRPPGQVASDGGGPFDGGANDAGEQPDACVAVTSCAAADCGLVPNGCGGFLNCAQCGTGTFCSGANRCEACATGTDLPDDGFADSDCDGIDGQLDGGVFLAANGNDSAAGTKDAPVATIAAALARARGSAHRTIYVASGSYDAGGLVWDAPVSIYGGFAADFSTRSELNPRPVFVASSAGVRVTVTDGGALFDHVAINAANASTTAGASVAMTVLNARAISLHHVTLRSGNGGPGATGVVGANGQLGATGLTGTTPTSTSVPPEPLGGAETANANCGATGGRGGTGGSHTFQYDSNELGVGEKGRAGSDNTLGVGDGGLRFTACDLRGVCGGCANTGPAGTGGKGSDGRDGAPGARGVGGTSFGVVTNGAWFSTFAGTGVTGQRGAGGNGGGGGGAHLELRTATTYCGFSLPGGGGGAGGAGGCGGQGGSGGQGGGGSIALLVANGSVSARNLSLQTGNGGLGGPGGQGGLGGRGGDSGGGANGFESGSDRGGPGGAGGRGGDGGTGGPGGGGAGGPTIGIYCNGASALNRDGGISFAAGTPGAPSDNGSVGLSDAGYGCPGFP